jgi:hypothetical protein
MSPNISVYDISDYTTIYVAMQQFSLEFGLYCLSLWHLHIVVWQECSLSPMMSVQYHQV